MGSPDVIASNAKRSQPGLDNHRQLHVCRMVTHPSTFMTLLREQLEVVGAANIQLTLISSHGDEVESSCREKGFAYVPIEMRRAITPLADARAAFHLLREFRRANFDVVHSSTPKAGLLAAAAGWLQRVPIRMHTFTGQPWVEMRGWRRALVKWGDRVIGLLTTQCYADSQSQAEFLISENVVARDKLTVLGAGSISGVNLDRFNRDRWTDEEARNIRSELGISEQSLIILFVGRITRDKGIVELLSAFRRLRSSINVELVLAGPFEPARDPLPDETMEELSNHPRVHLVGYTNEPERYMRIADVFCLPSYREGFGSVIIEAGAMGLPAVATSIVGIVDAVVADETGLLVPAKDVEALYLALDRILNDDELRASLGRRAQARSRKLFDADHVNQLVVEEYWKSVGS